MKGQEIKDITITLDDGVIINQCLIKEKDSGLYFSLDSSFVEQSVNPIFSAYGHGVIELSEDGEDGHLLEPQFLIKNYGGLSGVDGFHPSYPRELWIKKVTKDGYSLGYWDWVSHSLKNM
ncbi:MAG: hypothetical protein QM500_19825 [Methylococcales bacterium]